ncbi:MAG: DUF58 domain-containing protein [Rhizobiales bacterium]|nr:DUF58 domain-containing protein [Hyphomicrobiales bacterium]
MALRARLNQDDKTAVPRAVGAARTLAADIPRLILDARKVAATVIHGIHGRRRAGPGENFWQYRRFMSGEPANRVDWRRSARDDMLYVREQEWEAAHTIWLWPDRSPSMTFRSQLAQESKLERALMLTFALAEVLVDGGERVGVPGLMRPSGSRAMIDRMAEAIMHDPAERSSLPHGFAPAGLSEIVVLSDLWSPTDEVRKTIAQLSANGAAGHIVQVVDPAEEVFPYSGRIEFVEPETGEMITAGRAENWRADYEARIVRHRADIRADTDRLRWTFNIHRTDRSAADILLSLHARMGAGQDGTGKNRWRPAAQARSA